jgi:hypothetical protein
MKLICCACLLHTATVTVLENVVLKEVLITKYTPALKYVQTTKKTEIFVSGEFRRSKNLLPRNHFILLK